jgi:DNA-binding Lrp family transcriptional regulator
LHRLVAETAEPARPKPKPPPPRALLDRQGRQIRNQEAYATSGDTDYFLKIVVPDLKDLSVLLNEILLPNESVARVSSSVVLDRIKETAQLPLRSLAKGTAR